MLRNVLALIVGTVVAVAVVAGTEWLSHQIFGAADNMDLSSEAAIREFIAALPLGAILMVGLAWAAGAFFGSLVAGKLSTLRPRYCAVTISGLVLAAAITNLLLIPHPLWFTIAAPIAVVLAGFAATGVMTRSAK